MPPKRNANKQNRPMYSLGPKERQMYAEVPAEDLLRALQRPVNRKARRAIARNKQTSRAPTAEEGKKAYWALKKQGLVADSSMSTPAMRTQAREEKKTPRVGMNTSAGPSKARSGGKFAPSAERKSVAERPAQTVAIGSQDVHKYVLGSTKLPEHLVHNVRTTTLDQGGKKIRVVRPNGLGAMLSRRRQGDETADTSIFSNFFDQARGFLERQGHRFIGKKATDLVKKVWNKTKPYHGAMASALSAASGIDPTGAVFMPQGVAQNPRQFMEFGAGSTDENLLVTFCIPLYRVGYQGTGQSYASGWRGAMLFRNTDLAVPDWTGTVYPTSADRCMIGVSESPAVQAYTWSENPNAMVKTVAMRSWLSPVMGIMGSMFNNYRVARFLVHYAPQTTTDVDGQYVFSFNSDPSHAVLRLQEGDAEGTTPEMIGWAVNNDTNLLFPTSIAHPAWEPWTCDLSELAVDGEPRYISDISMHAAPISASDNRHVWLRDNAVDEWSQISHRFNRFGVMSHTVDGLVAPSSVTTPGSGWQEVRGVVFGEFSIEFSNFGPVVTTEPVQDIPHPTPVDPTPPPTDAVAQQEFPDTDLKTARWLWMIEQLSKRFSRGAIGGWRCKMCHTELRQNVHEAAPVFQPTPFVGSDTEPLHVVVDNPSTAPVLVGVRDVDDTKTVPLTGFTTTNGHTYMYTLPQNYDPAGNFYQSNVSRAGVLRTQPEAWEPETSSYKVISGTANPVDTNTLLLDSAVHAQTPSSFSYVQADSAGALITTTSASPSGDPVPMGITVDGSVVPVTGRVILASNSTPAGVPYISYHSCVDADAAFGGTGQPVVMPFILDGSGNHRAIQGSSATGPGGTPVAVLKTSVTNSDGTVTAGITDSSGVGALHSRVYGTGSTSTTVRPVFASSSNSLQVHTASSLDTLSLGSSAVVVSATDIGFHASDADDDSEDERK